MNLGLGGGFMDLFPSIYFPCRTRGDIPPAPLIPEEEAMPLSKMKTPKKEIPTNKFKSKLKFKFKFKSNSTVIK